MVKGNRVEIVKDVKTQRADIGVKFEGSERLDYEIPYKVGTALIKPGDEIVFTPRGAHLVRKAETLS